MKVFQVIAAASLFVAAAVGAQAASFIGQTVDGALIAGPDMSVTTQFRSPITAPGTFDGVMQDNFDDTWNVTLQVLSTEVIVGWTGTGDGNIGGPSNLVTVDLSGYTNGAILGLDRQLRALRQLSLHGSGRSALLDHQPDLDVHLVRRVVRGNA